MKMGHANEKVSFLRKEIVMIEQIKITWVRPVENTPDGGIIAEKKRQEVSLNFDDMLVASELFDRLTTVLKEFSDEKISILG